MKTIYKYPVLIVDSFSLELPTQSKILAFQVQEGEPFIWALVDTGHDLEERFFSVRGTGNLIEPERAKSDIYIGTVQMQYGFVWHLFEVMK